MLKAVTGCYSKEVNYQPKTSYAIMKNAANYKISGIDKL